jgi:GT2 family glycosyltransferase
LKDQPLVSIIISNYNAREFLKECIISLKRSSYANFEILVVDAGSTDGSAQMVKKEFPDVKVIQAGRVGIGTAINIGIKEAKGEIIIFDLNSDDIVDENWLLNLVTAIRRHNYDIVACGKRYIYGTKKIDSAGAKINRLTGSFPPIGRGKLDNSKFEVIAEVDYVPVIATSKRVVEEVGLCDNEYEIYFEDTDFCYRAKRKGFKIIYVPTAKFYHRGSATIGKVNQRKVYYMFRNRLYFVIKNFPLPYILSSILFTPMWLISEFLEMYRSAQFNTLDRFAISSFICACKEAVKWNITNLRKILATRDIS